MQVMAENQLRQNGDIEGENDGRAYDLHSVVVDQETGPTRCTIYPRSLSRDERTTTWLSADHSAFYDLESMR